MALATAALAMSVACAAGAVAAADGTALAGLTGRKTLVVTEPVVSYAQPSAGADHSLVSQSKRRPGSVRTAATRWPS